MGEPATPTPAERAATLKYARDMIDAVVNDEDDGVGLETFRLCQDLVDTRAALDAACDALNLVADGDPYDRDIWLDGKTERVADLAARLRRLDLEGK